MSYDNHVIFTGTFYEPQIPDIVNGHPLKNRVDFYALTDFNVVIAKPDRRVIYSGCQWTEISEAASAGDLLFETVTIAASKRVEAAV